MGTCIKIKISIAIMQATIIGYKKSTRQEYKIKNRLTYQKYMDQARHLDARHILDTSQLVRRSPTKPPPKKIVGQPTKTHTRLHGNTEARPSAEVAHSTSRQPIWFRNIYIYVQKLQCWPNVSPTLGQRLVFSG